MKGIAWIAIFLPVMGRALLIEEGSGVSLNDADIFVTAKCETASLRIDSLRHTINSPNYPRHYSSNNWCSWKIVAPSGRRLKLHFNAFLTEEDYDELTVHNGPDGRASLISKLSGSSVPRDITSASNSLYLFWTTDNGKFRLGWEISISSFATRPATATIKFEAGTEFGELGHAEFCPPGSFANAFDLKIDPYVSRDDVDNTVLNGIRLNCVNDQNNFTGNVDSFYGPWGEWQGTRKCPGNANFLTAIRFKSSPWQGYFYDDTAGHEVDGRCMGLVYGVWELVKGNGGTLVTPGGTWTDFMYCPHNTAICGIKTSVEFNVGNSKDGKDNTALNDVTFYCCRL